MCDVVIIDYKHDYFGPIRELSPEEKERMDKMYAQMKALIKKHNLKIVVNGKIY